MRAQADPTLCWRGGAVRRNIALQAQAEMCKHHDAVTLTQPGLQLQPATMRATVSTFTIIVTET